MAKRLTLTEYRQENAVWLSNEYAISPHNVFEKYLINRYISYLIAYGIILFMNEIKCAGEYPTESEIEAHLLSKQTEVTEHCPH
jgi:hypothetical protein